MLKAFVLLILLLGAVGFYAHQIGWLDKITIHTASPTTLQSTTYKPFIPPSRYGNNYKAKNIGKNTVDYRNGQNIDTYYAYVPKSVGTTPAPVVFAFHGGQRSGASMIEKWKSTADKKGFILIAPHAKTGAWDYQIDSDQTIINILKDTQQKYNVDTSRLYIFGHSSGGNLVHHILIKHPRVFAAAAIHSGLIHPDNLPGYKDTKRTPTAIINGTNDDLSR